VTAALYCAYTDTVLCVVCANWCHLTSCPCLLADAWIFQPPLSPEMLTEMDFYMGLPRCDNRLVHVLQQHNYTVLDPAFAVHAIELDSPVRTQVLYNIQQTVVGATQTLLLSDQFVF
jgi:hypothetical protein